MKTVIIGGVAAGAGTAARLRRNDENAQIIMMERSGYISFANCGLPYYIGGVIKHREKLLLQTPEGFGKRFDIDVRIHTEVTGVDVDSKLLQVTDLETGRTYVEDFDILILAPGAKSIRPKLPGGEDRLFTLRNIEDTDQINNYIQMNSPRHAAIIGGGAIGIEMAENLIGHGIKVSVIDMANHVIQQLDDDMVGEITDYLKGKGVDIYTVVYAQSVEDGHIVLSDGSTLPADLIVSGIGVLPDTGFLKKSGVQLGEKGEILVDEQFRTNIPDIYAVGDAIAVERFGSDISAVIPLASPANKQGRLVADIICGSSKVYNGSQGTNIVKVFDFTVATTGFDEKILKMRQIPYRKSITRSPSNASYYPVHDYMTIKLLFSPEVGKVLGAQIVGGSGVDKRIDVIATAIRADMTIYDLQELELSYAPPYSSAKDPVNMAAYVAENILSGVSHPFYAEDLSNLHETAVLLDVRSQKEYLSGTILDAISIPVDELRERLGELDKEKEYYIFCKTGQRSYIAERILRQRGFRAKNLMGGYLFYKNQL